MLLEAGLSFKSLSRSDLPTSDEVESTYPVGKLPLAIIDGKVLFESAAICTYLADHSPDIDLIAKPGSWARSQHDQWTSFALTEMEAWLWNTAVNKFILPPEQRIEAGFRQNAMMFGRSASVLNNVLSRCDYLVENRFTVTDIIVGYSLNWARRQGLTESFPSIDSYLKRLFSRENCVLPE